MGISTLAVKLLDYPKMNTYIHGTHSKFPNMTKLLLNNPAAFGDMRSNKKPTGVNYEKVFFSNLKLYKTL